MKAIYIKVIVPIGEHQVEIDVSEETSHAATTKVGDVVRQLKAILTD